MSARDIVIRGFQPLSPAEAEQVSKRGSTRKWIEGEGQLVSWAEAYAQLLNKDSEEREWEEVVKLDTSMKGILPRNWALMFSGGKVTEA